MNVPASAGPDEPASGTGNARTSGDHAARERAARNRRLDEMFDAALPGATSDQLADSPDADAGERWYLESRPPHHG